MPTLHLLLTDFLFLPLLSLCVSFTSFDCQPVALMIYNLSRHYNNVQFTTIMLPCSSRMPFGIFLSTVVTTAFLWFFNLPIKWEKHNCTNHRKGCHGKINSTLCLITGKNLSSCEQKSIHPTIWSLKSYSFSLAEVLERQLSSPNMVQNLVLTPFCCLCRSTVTAYSLLTQTSMRGSQLAALPDWAPPQWLKEEAFVSLISAPEPGSQPVSEGRGEGVRWGGCVFTWGSTRLAVQRWAAAGTRPARWGGCDGWRM